MKIINVDKHSSLFFRIIDGGQKIFNRRKQKEIDEENIPAPTEDDGLELRPGKFEGSRPTTAPGNSDNKGWISTVDLLVFACLVYLRRVKPFFPAK